MTEIPEEFTNVPEISKAIELTQEASYTKEELAQYDGYWDQISLEKTIKSEEKAEGKAEGRVEIALKMISKNLDNETIMECSGLTSEELAQPKNLFKNNQVEWAKSHSV